MTSTPVASAADILPRAAIPAGLTSRMQPQQVILIALLIVELAVFSFIGKNFLTPRNAFEVLRLSVELGLLALALTPVIVTGGIDLSVGSLLSLSAILMGLMWRDFGFPLWLAMILASAFGALAGGFNGLLITRLRIPPLIVTLGTFSLFSGLAEGITGGAKNYTHFPEWFTDLGQGAQVPLFIVAIVAFWILLHRMTIGRSLSAIGFAPEGAAYAAIPVWRRIALTYVLSGLSAGVAAVVYVTHWGQAKADAGTGMELEAITAVVLGGTSIFGGRGSILGTVMGLFAIALLKNGLGLADQPRELTAILTGLLLLVAIGLDQYASRRKGASARKQIAEENAEELNMKNTQLAVLSAAILVAALIIFAGNYALVRAIQQNGNRPVSVTLKGGGTGAGVAADTTPDPTSHKEVTVAMMPKSKGNAYFIACRKGAVDAAKDLNVKLIWDGPTDPAPAKQNEIVETWITRGVDVIAVAVENQDGISPVLRKARQKGIKVITFDSDANPDARDFFVNQATPQGIGFTLMDNAAKVLGGKGEFAIITASLTSANMNEWRKYIEQRRAEKYPDIKLVTTEPCDDKQQVAFDKANAILNANPNVKLIMAICSPGVPGAAEAVSQSGRKDVKVLGLGLPNDNKKYVHSGITDDIVLWNTMDLGYLTVYASQAVVTGALKPGSTTFEAGRLKTLEIKGDNVLLGKPFTFTKDNIDQFDF